eukprot:3353553-Pleurochrysis_carterae.AAC.3
MLASLVHDPDAFLGPAFLSNASTTTHPLALWRLLCRRLRLWCRRFRTISGSPSSTRTASSARTRQRRALARRARSDWRAISAIGARGARTLREEAAATAATAAAAAAAAFSLGSDAMSMRDRHARMRGPLQRTHERAAAAHAREGRCSAER